MNLAVNPEIIREAVDLENFKQLGSKFIAKLGGVNSVELASQYKNLFLAVRRQQLPATPGSHYWHDLMGARVISLYMGREIMLGTISNMQRLPANDIMEVQGTQGKLHYIPFIQPTYVYEVVLPTTPALTPTVKVNWDPDF